MTKTRKQTSPTVGEERFMASIWKTPPLNEDGDSDWDRVEEVNKVYPTLDKAKAGGVELAKESAHGYASIHLVRWSNDYGDDGEYDPRFKCYWMIVGEGQIDEVYSPDE